MLVWGLKPGHDGAVAALRDGKLLHSLEPEKDSFPRYAALTTNMLLHAAEQLDQIPDVIALGGWREQGTMRHRAIGAGYEGLDAIIRGSTKFFGKTIRFFSSSHERSHVMMAIGMAPRAQHRLQTVLVWEGDTGRFYLIDHNFEIVRNVPVLSEPGGRYAFLFALADPTFPDDGALPRLGDSGKLMALAAYGDAAESNADIGRTVDRILELDTVYPSPKRAFRDTPLYNAGVESSSTKTAAALLTDRIFTVFARAAEKHLPPETPLRISGGCGLNCEWNSRWAKLGHFSSVFVPPCPNDSGSAIGTAIDALAAFTGDPYIDWDVYCGLEFERDAAPDPARWDRATLDCRALAKALARGEVAAWVQGRWEIGPRALGNRSILAEPFSPSTQNRLNTIKQRESYRPVAPCCRIEDVDKVFHEGFEDPYMLYFRRVRADAFYAVTHVDGSARVQTVSRDSNPALHSLLTAFAEQCGVGVLCNTSLNFKGHGFVNRMSDLVQFCEARGIDNMVVGDSWFRTRTASGETNWT